MDDKWATEAATPTVEYYHSAIRRLVAERLASTGKSWEEAVFDPALEFSADDFAAIDKELLVSGYRFEVSALVSAREEPEKYKPVQLVGDSGNQPADDLGRTIVGTGDNVIQTAADLVGVARFISSLETVLDLIEHGVPCDTIAVIDDSGGTLTAPILQFFSGVLCMGGTVRSHLGILTREFGIPCFMAAELDGLRDGDRVLVECSRPATNAYASRNGAVSARPRVIRVS